MLFAKRHLMGREIILIRGVVNRRRTPKVPQTLQTNHPIAQTPVWISQGKRYFTFRRTQLRYWSASHDFSSQDYHNETSHHQDIGLGLDHGHNAQLNDDTFQSVEKSAELNSSYVNQSCDPERHTIINALAEEIKNNVQVILRRIERAGHSEGTKQGGDNKEHSVGDRQARKSLQTRWQIAKRKEKGNLLFYIREGYWGNFSTKPFHKMTIDELWEASLQPAGLETFLADPDQPHSSTFLEERDLSDIADLSSVVSPIFGVPIDSDGNIELPDGPQERERLEDGFDLVHGPIDEAAAFPLGQQQHRPPDVLIEGVADALALFATLGKTEWDLITSTSSNHEQPFQNGEDEEVAWERNRTDFGHELLQHMRQNENVPSSDESNVLLAHRLTSLSRSDEEILERSVQLFDAMVDIKRYGMDDCEPDSVTYRLLLLAFSQRLAATGEASRVCHTAAVSCTTLSPDTLHDAMRVCQSSGDMETASNLMSKALHSDDMTQPTMGACRIYIDMLKSRNMMQEAIAFYGRIRKAEALAANDGDLILSQLCQWPSKSRNGEAIDCTPVLVYCVDSFLERLKGDHRPRLQVFLKLVERMARAASMDPSLDNRLNSTIRKVFQAYPEAWPGIELLTIGLKTAKATRDADLMAMLISREVDRRLEIAGGKHNQNDGVTETAQTTPIPHIIFRKAFEIALIAGDFRSASSVLTSFQHVEGEYSSNVKLDIHGLALVCFTRVGQTDEAKTLLTAMVENGLNPSEDMFGAVLRNLFANDKDQDANELLHQMETESNFPKPSTSSFTALLYSHVRRKEWTEAIALRERMRTANAPADSQTIQGLILAHAGCYGQRGVTAFLKEITSSQFTVDRATFLLATRILVPHMKGKELDEIRMEIRKIGEQAPALRGVSLALIRSARIAEAEGKKLESGNRTRSIESSTRTNVASMWRTTLANLLYFVEEAGRLGISLEQS